MVQWYLKKKLDSPIKVLFWSMKCFWKVLISMKNRINHTHTWNKSSRNESRLNSFMARLTEKRKELFFSFRIVIKSIGPKIEFANFPIFLQSEEIPFSLFWDSDKLSFILQRSFVLSLGYNLSLLNFQLTRKLSSVL